MAAAKVFAIVASLLLVSCTSGGAMARDVIEVDATFEDANTLLEVTWAVFNRGGKPLLALVRPLRHDNTEADQAIYVRQGKDGSVEFALRAFDVPEGVNPATLDHIGAVPLAPGQRIEGRASVPLPLETHEPYRTPTALASGTGTARVCIGVLDADAAFPASSRQPEGVIATYHDRRVAPLQRIACSAAVDLPDAVKPR